MSDSEQKAVELAEYEISFMSWVEVCNLAKEYLAEQYHRLPSEALEQRWRAAFHQGTSTPQGSASDAQMDAEELWGIPFNK